MDKVFKFVLAFLLIPLVVAFVAVSASLVADVASGKPIEANVKYDV